MFFLFSTAKPLHHHGRECLRLKVDVVGPHGKSFQFFTLPTRHFCNLNWIIRTTEALLTAPLNHLILGSKNKKKTVEKEGEMEVKAVGGVHNPSNRLPAGENFSSVTLLFASGSVSICFRKDVEFLDFPSQGVRVTLRKLHGHEMYSSSFSLLLSDDPIAMIPVVQRSVGSSGVRVAPVSSFVTLISLLIFLLLHWAWYKKTLWTLIR